MNVTKLFKAFCLHSHSWLSVQKVYSFPFLVLCTKGLLISILGSLYKRSTPSHSWLSVQKVYSFPFLVLCTKVLLISIHGSLYKRSTGHCTPWLAFLPVLIINGLCTDFCENRSPIACMVLQSASSDDCYCAEFCLHTWCCSHQFS